MSSFDRPDMEIIHNAVLTSKFPYLQNAIDNGCKPTLIMLLACEAGIGDVFDYLISKGVKPNSACLNSAICCRQISIVDKILESGYVPDSNNLQYAFTYDQQYVGKLIMYGADVNQHNEGEPSLLYRAVNYGRQNIVSLLLSLGANVVDKEGNTPLEMAIKKGNQQIIDMLIKHGA